MKLSIIFDNLPKCYYYSENRYITSWECCLVAWITKQIKQILSTSCSLFSIWWGRENPLIFVFSFANSFRYPNLPVKISVSYIVTPIWWGRRSEAELGTWMGRRVTSSKRCYNAGNTELRRERVVYNSRKDLITSVIESKKWSKASFVLFFPGLLVIFSQEYDRCLKGGFHWNRTSIMSPTTLPEAETQVVQPLTPGVGGNKKLECVRFFGVGRLV